MASLWAPLRPSDLLKGLVSPWGAAPRSSAMTAFACQAYAKARVWTAVHGGGTGEEPHSHYGQRQFGLTFGAHGAMNYAHWNSPIALCMHCGAIGQCKKLAAVSVQAPLRLTCSTGLRAWRAGLPIACCAGPGRPCWCLRRRQQGISSGVQGWAVALVHITHKG